MLGRLISGEESCTNGESQRQFHSCPGIDVPLDSSLSDVISRRRSSPGQLICRADKTGANKSINGDP